MTVVSSIRTSTGKLAAGAFLALSLSLAGCASTQGVNTVSPGAVGQSSRVYHGTIMSVREVTIQPKQSMIGTTAGAVLGGLAGSELGGGDKAQTAGAIGGAVLDVFETQPLAADHPFLSMPNVILTPHMAGITEESMLRMGQGVVGETRAILGGEKPVNFCNPDVWERYRARFPS